MSLPFFQRLALPTTGALLLFLAACATKPTPGGAVVTPATVTITRPNLYPEGLAYDAATNHFLVSSFTAGTLGQVQPDGTYTTFADDPQLISSLGLYLDAPRNRVLTAVTDIGVSSRSTPATQGKLAALASFDRTTGHRLAYTDLGGLRPAGAHFANDIAVDTQGNVYVTDSYAPIIYKVDVNGTASVFLENNRFTQAAGKFGLNGIVYHPDGYLLAVKSDEGTLYKVPLANPQAFTQVTTSALLVSADGLSLTDKNTLVVAANAPTNTISRLQTTDNWATATATGTFATGNKFATTLARWDADLYVLYAHLDAMVSGQTPPAQQFSLQKVTF